ncbi:putative branched-chain amino acid transport ATP-binding protein LivG [Thermoplasmatales archaeon]|nr:putative branched-chain amino acid transport ATP-binding protein LivG [Thermoplasmatales archaeon]
MKLLECTDIRKSYGLIKRSEALKGVSLSLERGQCLAVVGPNGAGKTTLLRILGGVIATFQGNLKVRGNIGYCSETTSNYPYLTGYENLNFFGEVSGSSTEVTEVLRKVRLDNDRKLVFQYSKGMKRKLEIARSLILDADIVIMDEPFDGLDPIISKDIANILVRLKEEGKGIILTSHDLYRIQDVADEVYFMSNGKFSRHETLTNFLRLKVGFQDKARNGIDLSFLGRRLLFQNRDVAYLSLENTDQISDLVEEMMRNGVKIKSVGLEPLEDLFMEIFNEQT